MNKKLENRLAQLESEFDQLSSELTYIDSLLKSVGFPHGLASAKEVAVEIIQHNEVKESDNNHDL